ncbi:MAG: family 78 glycoside hydrolase catalytic domain, partial [Planctomycetota bacterium]
MKRCIPAALLGGFVLFLLIECAFSQPGEGLVPIGLRVEHRVDPQGIDTLNPRLSWIVETEARSWTQSAYRILVAGSADLLAVDQGDLWDSGKVSSQETVDIRYVGRPFTSRQQCFWKVKVWDGEDAESEWSKPASWSMGLLNPGDWQADWIGLDRVEGAEGSDAPCRNLKESQWIWYAEGSPAESAAVGIRFFRKTFQLPENQGLVNAFCLLTADNEFVLYCNGQLAGKGDDHARAYQIDLSALVQAGENVLAVEAANRGDAPNPAGIICALRIDFDVGDPLLVRSDASWMAAQKAEPGWKEKGFDDSAWSAILELGPCGAEPWRDVSTPLVVLPPPRYLRHDFNLRGTVERAMLYATGLGIFDLHLNGRPVSKDYFTPGWTDYDQRIYYRAYDVTKLMKSGDNTMAAVLADGWYAGYIGYGRERNHYGENLRLRAQLYLEHKDGSKRLITTGPKWKAAVGPLLEADFLMGESYDAREEMPGWNAPGFDDSAWQPVDITKDIEAPLQAHPSGPVRAFAELEPVKILEPKEGQFIFDLGQNFAGVVRLKVKGDRGRKVTLRFGERLNEDGTLHTENLRSARTTDTYILSGSGTEVWQPRFTFHGFQYVELTGFPGKPSRDTITGIALSSDTPKVGSFSCSDETINRLVGNIYWTQRANFIDIPTDCPQRDERLGWTGDAQVYIRTACWLTDAQAFFAKWLVDLADAQREDGQFPMVAPLKVARGDGGPGWADAGTICPWAIYEMYGDRRALEQHYQAMRRFVDFCRDRSPDLLPPEKFHCFGDWLNIEAETPKDVIYTAYFARSARLVTQAAEVLNKSGDAKKYEELFQGIRKAFNKAYVDDEGRIKGDTQTAYVMALAFDLLDRERYEQAARHLVADLEARRWHLSTGFLGTKDLMLVLSKIGRTDVAYRLLHNDTFPSWGFTIKHGATSIWERWNGWTPEDGFNNPGMNSFAHYAFGAVGQWM